MHAVIISLLSLLFLTMVLVGKAMGRVPLPELRRRARLDRDRGLYGLECHGQSGRLAVDILAVACIWAVVELTAKTWWQIGLITIAVAAVVSIWRGPQPGSPMWRLANSLAAMVARLFSWLPVASMPQATSKPHTGLYDKEDLLDLLNKQLTQTDNRISAAELKAALAILGFGGKKVADAMTPLAKAKLVVANESIGPHLLDELHKYKTDCFLVVKDQPKSAKAEAVGTLYLQAALEHSRGGTVADAMTLGVIQIDEDIQLIQALSGFLENKCHVMAVRNGFDEMVGVLTLAASLEQIFGPRSLPKESKNYIDGDKLALNGKRENASKPAKK